MVILLCNASLADRAVFAAGRFRESACCADVTWMEDDAVIGEERNFAGDVLWRDVGCGGDAFVEHVVRNRDEGESCHAMKITEIWPCCRDKGDF